MQTNLNSVNVRAEGNNLTEVIKCDTLCDYPNLTVQCFMIGSVCGLAIEFIGNYNVAVKNFLFGCVNLNTDCNLIFICQ